MDTEETRQLRRRIAQLEQENTQLRKTCNMPTSHTKNKCKVRLGKAEWEEPGNYKEVRKRYPNAYIEEL